MKIALAQINTTIGDFAGNKAKILDFMGRAHDMGADIVVFPELATIGYPPRDLLEKPYIIQRNKDILKEVAERSDKIAAVIGFVDISDTKTGRGLFNSAAFCYHKKVQFIQHKRLLPDYDVFDEYRYFEPAVEQNIYNFKGIKIGITLCEDAWSEYEFNGRRLYHINPVEDLVKSGAQMIINLSASPYSLGKSKVREDLVSKHAKKYKLPIFVCNQVGGNDDLVFDGRSFAVDSKGKIISKGKAFDEDLLLVDSEDLVQHHDLHELGETEELHQALVLGLRDYVNKCGFNNAILGLSGGIDSALVAVLAKEALGSDRVFAFAMPSPYSSEASLADAEQLAKNLEIKLQTIQIENIYKQYLKTLDSGSEISVVEENFQARIRGNILMAISNREGAIVLSTGNKSELAVGYCTLYGDMVGGLAVISDIPKTKVYELARYINRNLEIIPQNIIDKAPSAELKPNQKDEDLLPPYELLDKILKLYVEEHMSAKSIKSMRFDPEIVDKVVRLVDGNEYKRRQAAPGLKVTSKAFGAGRRFPIAWRYT